ncbi:MAG: hypothetical protein VB119_02895 [Candidatus Metalachnospira sp.]|nr:hypothetical protein [Candidatus Metalachnospira sp.]
MFSWIEVYISFNQEEFFKIKSLLENEGINIKTKVSNPTRDRMNTSVVMGGNPLILNRAGMDSSAMDECKIYVKKDNKDEALRLIQKFRHDMR